MSTGSGTTSITSCNSTHSSAMNLRKLDLPALMLPSTQSVTRPSEAFLSAAAARSLLSAASAEDPSSSSASAAASSSPLAWISATWSAILMA